MSEYISLQGSRELTESEHYAEYQDTFEFQVQWTHDSLMSCHIFHM